MMQRQKKSQMVNVMKPKKKFNEITQKIDFDNFSYRIHPITKYISIWMPYREGFIFENKQILSILDYQVIKVSTVFHFGYNEPSHIHKTLTS